MNTIQPTPSIRRRVSALLQPDSSGEPVLRVIFRTVLPPLLGIFIFLVLWDVGASHVHTSLGTLPGPVAVMKQAGNLYQEYQDEQGRKAAFEERQKERKAEFQATNPGQQFDEIKYTGQPTYLDQIFTSLYTVFVGFFLGTIIAVPLGILCGLNKTIQAALNPLIQIFRPVSPLAWLPIVTLVVSALYVSADPMFAKSFLISAITVTLCSMWPTLVNTALGVASIDKDLLNVSKVLRLSTSTKVMKIVIPSSLKLIFTGMRLSLGVAWMVLIAAEMLAQNPGLGKFVWDEFQNGSSQSLERIMVAVFTIGFVGFLLDRTMHTLQQMASFGQRTN
ncbi:ABC transporter permease [Sideroxydans lithotrophicus]|uniref:Binding-protein-dependent transport systems inner membrane component n=1 Tax=Sideroxydans lithotrophicus (strain ES-1) TaxID=580332 RepID=D5CU63_SIDLE|nr:ABC transporter permease [Sideroxydans lithotrophicus]ADE10398.1 binding-protein-dependent transport systems inner membrane component [Sideroxydans lithotrophicus ES-1]